MPFMHDGSHQICFWKKRYITFSESLDSGYHPTFTWDDYHMIPKVRPHVNKPEPNYKIMNVPNSSDRFEYTSYMPGGLTFGARSGKWDFIIDQDRWGSWAYAFREISEFFNGERMYMALNDDPTIMYSGRFKVTDYNPEPNYSIIQIEYDLDADPVSYVPNLQYRVRFLDFYGRVIFTDFLSQGSVPYPSVNLPNVPGFEFVKWDPYIRPVNGNIDYRARYKSVMTFNLKPVPLKPAMWFIDGDSISRPTYKSPLNVEFIPGADYDEDSEPMRRIHAITALNNNDIALYQAYYVPTNVRFLDEHETDVSTESE